MARILVVDDSATLLAGTRKILESAGHEVLAAENGELGVAKSISDKPDLIVMDVVMPGISGFQATRQITNNPETKDIPIIMLTTKDQETDKVWATRQGAKDYVIKPPEKKELLAKISALLV